MRSPTLALASLLGLSLAACGGAGDDDDSAPADDDTASDDDTADPDAWRTVYDQVPSALRDQPVDLGIYLPASYGTAGPYPVVYLLHGDGGDETSWLEGSETEQSDVKVVADTAVAAGEMPEVVIVTPDASVDVAALGGDWPTMTYFDPGNFYVDSALTGPTETILMTEVLPYVEANYDVLPGPGHRGLMGHSMGGFGTLYLALRYGSSGWAAACAMSPMAEFYILTLSGPNVAAENPDLDLPVPGDGKEFTNLYYSLAAAFSPNLAAPPWFVDHPIDWTDDDLPIVQEVFDRWFVYDPMTLVDDPALQANLASIPLRMDVGDADDYFFNVMTYDFSTKLDALGIQHEYEVYEGYHSDRVYERLALDLPWTAVRAAGMGGS